MNQNTTTTNANTTTNLNTPLANINLTNQNTSNRQGSTNRNCTQGFGRQGNNHRPNNRNYDQGIKNFKCTTPEIGTVLALPKEHVHADKGFPKFQEDLETCILKELKNPDVVVGLVTDFIDPNITVLHNMPEPVFSQAEVQDNPMKAAVNDQIAKIFENSIGIVRSNVAKIYGIIWGQCTPGLQAELKSLDDYDAHAATYDAVWLLRESMKLAAGVATKGNPYANMFDVMDHFMNKVTQGRHESEEAWYRLFKAECDTLEVAGLGYFFHNAAAAGHDDANLNPPGNDIATEMEKCRAILFLKKSNIQHYPALMDFLTNNELVGNDQFPETLVGVYELLLSYQNKQLLNDGGNPNHCRNNSNRNGGISFLQQRQDVPPTAEEVRNPVPGNDGRVMQRRCYFCGAYGHISTHCPDATRGTDTPNVQAL